MSIITVILFILGFIVGSCGYWFIIHNKKPHVFVKQPDIKLFNRDGANVRLVNCDENLWEFEVDDEHKYILEYMRVGFEDDNKTINFIDPSGGPYLSRGQRISKKYVINAIVEIDDKLKIQMIESEV